LYDASTQEKVSIQDLKNSFEYEFIAERGILEDEGFSCRYWDELLEAWNADGCETKSISEIQATGMIRIVCECNHLTDFSLVGDVAAVF